MFFIPLVFGGAAATYMHKKFPKATEAAAAGVAMATIWTAKKVGQLAEKGLDKIQESQKASVVKTLENTGGRAMKRGG